MEKHEFPMCCGATIICGFGPPGGQLDWPTEAKLTRYLNEKVEQNGRGAFIIAILRPDQREKLGKTFRACGFKRKALGDNIRHANELSLFVYCNKEKG